LRGRETDATFLVRRVAALPADERTREAYYDAINPSCELLSGPDTPSRTRAALPGVRPAWQAARCGARGPTSRQELGRPPGAFRPAAPAQAETLIALAREAMVTRPPRPRRVRPTPTHATSGGSRTTADSRSR